MTHRGAAPFGDPAPCVRQRCVHTTLCRLPDGITPRGTVSCRAGLTARAGGPGPLTPARRGQVLGQGASAHAGATASASSPPLPAGVCAGPGAGSFRALRAALAQSRHEVRVPRPATARSGLCPGRPSARGGARSGRHAALTAALGLPRTPEASAAPRAPRALLGRCTATERERDPGPASFGSSPAARSAASRQLTARSLRAH